MSMSETEGYKPQETWESIGRAIEVKAKAAFPDYSVVDRSEFDGYVRVEDPGNRGRIIKFHTSEGTENGKPAIWFVFHDEVFDNISLYDLKPATDAPIWGPIAQAYGPIWGRGGSRTWRNEAMDLAIDKAKIFTEGVDPQDPAFRVQLAGWDTEGNFITMGYKVDQQVQYKGMKSSPAKKGLLADMKRVNKVWNLFESDPDRAKELVMRRIEISPAYVIGGREYPQDLIGQFIRTDAPLGAVAVMQELNRIDSITELLKNHGLLHIDIDRK
jgi:hypothetical protein